MLSNNHFVRDENKIQRTVINCNTTSLPILNRSEYLCNLAISRFWFAIKGTVKHLYTGQMRGECYVIWLHIAVYIGNIVRDNWGAFRIS